jgi:hypothetical protein
MDVLTLILVPDISVIDVNVNVNPIGNRKAVIRCVLIADGDGRWHG